MKKIIFGMLTIFALVGTVQVNAQDNDDRRDHKMQNNDHRNRKGRVKYWYYPSNNVYYNDTNSDYWYYDTPSSTWMNGKSLPNNYVIDNNADRYEVWSNNNEVWRDNANHMKKYKVKRNGRIVEKDK